MADGFCLQAPNKLLISDISGKEFTVVLEDEDDAQEAFQLFSSSIYDELDNLEIL
jgi:hypothetical protein